MGIATVRKLLPSDTKVLLLEDFVRDFAPMLCNDDNKETEVISEQLRDVIIAPLQTCRVAPHIRKAECREPVNTLVDDVVYFLVRRQERFRRRKNEIQCRKRTRAYMKNNKIENKDGDSNGNCNGDDPCTNALTHGFTCSREGDAPPPSGMRLGISCRHPNENVMYCKSSPIIYQLHRLVGDEVLRMILLHTRCFMPIVTKKSGVVMEKRNSDDGNNSDNGNYILLCGPPLSSNSSKNSGHHKIITTKISTEKRIGNKDSVDDLSSDISIKYRRKKKRRLFPREVKPGSHLDANETISRFSLMYCEDYIPHIGLPKTHPFQQQMERQRQRMIFSATSGNHNDQEKHQQQDCRFVLNVIFELHLENKNKQKRIRKRAGESGQKVCEKIWKGHSSGCDYSRLLERHCGLTSDVQEVSKTLSSMESSLSLAGGNPLARLAQAFTPKKYILSFLGSVLRRVFPIKFWGSEQNFQSIMTSVQSFVHLRRKERLTNKNIMHGISITQIEWLYHDNSPSSVAEDDGRRKRCDRRNRKKQRKNHETATELTLKILRWLFRGFIIPLLRSSFYVTETEFSGQQLHYYRKPVWSLFRFLSIQKLIRGNHFKTLSYAQARQNLKQQQLGLARLRFLPKLTGMRPIAQLSRSQYFNFQQVARNADRSSISSRKRLRSDDERDCHRSKKPKVGEKASTRYNHVLDPSCQPLKTMEPEELSYRSAKLPTNVILGKVLEVLSYECGKRDNPYGNGVDNLQHFYQRYRNYVTHLKKQRHKISDGEMKIQLFFAKVDIEKCYDRMNQDFLLDLVQDLVLHNTFVVQRVKMDCANLKRGGANVVRYKKIVDAVDDYRSFYVGEHALAQGNQNTVFDLYNCSLVARNKVMNLLREHILQHTVISSGRYDKKLLLQSSGISQGSKLSMLLCNLYYGNVEKFMFGVTRELTDSSEQMVDTVQPRRKKTGNDFMSRFVDDFIFITLDKDSFERFLDRTYRGKPKLGAQINPSKTLVNVETSIRVETEDGGTKHVPVCSSNRRNHNGTILFPWCGLLFDTQTCETFIDYKRFRCGRLHDGLTVDYDGSEGRKMEYRMQSFVYPRCLPILYDSSINSFDTVVTNFYQMMLFAAAKTAEYLRGHSSMLPNSSTVYNIDYVLRCIRGLSQFALQNIKSKFKNSFKKVSDFSKMIGINKFLASFLCGQAFCDVFSYLSDFMDISRRMFEEYSSSYANLRHGRKTEIQRIISRAMENFQIRYMIQR